MALTLEQLAAIKAAILAETDPAFVAARTDGNNEFMLQFFNSVASPTYTVWRTSVPLSEVVGEVDGVELVGLTSVKLAAYQSLLLAGAVNPSKARIRAGFDQVFSAAGGATTRPLLLALWKRQALRIEKLFATGAGSDAAPSALVVEGELSSSDLVLALSL